ncbi:UNVERIFIED_CONTAM: hypothetical protein PYX00_004982 [Menopon gallinae]|uniref:Amino acid transporter transmembrane domain-containing protein n=1 Tax=Menopon gallinae TaxID=328185 RepID=A0AAW2I647_9NEOP
MKYKRESRTWRSSADLDTESDANDAEPLLSDASVTSRRSFGAICMFPDASETSDFEYSRQVPTTSGKGSGATSVRSPYFLQTMSNIQKDSSAMADCITRFQYYSKIKNFIKRDDSRTVIPEHVVPSSVFVPYIPGSDQQPGKQSSIVTIFAVWNTIMGSSLLTMPWGIERAGLVTGIVFMLIMGAICLYTSYLLLRVQQLHGGGNVDWEVADLAGFLLGRKYEMVAKFFSLVVLLGANIVYWILMSNFLYHSVDYIYERVLRGDIMSMNFINNSTVICPKNMTIPSLQPTNNSVVLKKAAYEGDTIDLYDQIWNIHTTVPIFLTLILGPLVNFKSATFFTKFNSLESPGQLPEFRCNDCDSEDISLLPTGNRLPSYCVYVTSPGLHDSNEENLPRIPACFAPQHIHYNDVCSFCNISPPDWNHYQIHRRPKRFHLYILPSKYATYSFPQKARTALAEINNFTHFNHVLWVREPNGPILYIRTVRLNTISLSIFVEKTA